MSDGRNAADNESGLFTYKIGVYFGERVAQQCRNFLFVNPVCAAGDDQHRAPGACSIEDDALGYLCDIAVD